MTTKFADSLGPVDQGRSLRIYDDTLTGTQTLEKLVLLTADSILVSLWVDALASATLEVSVTTIMGANQEFPIIAFPVMAGPTSQLLLRKASLAMDKVLVRVQLTGSGTTSFKLDLKGINIGETTTKIAGSAQATAVPYLAGPSPALLIPAGLQDRAAVQVLNNGPAGTLYLGFTPAEATAANGYPVGLGGYWSGDLAAGASLYASTSGQVIDVRTIQAYG